MIKKFAIFFISIPKTIFYNFKFFDLKVAIKLPILIAYNCKIKGKKGQIQLLNTNINRFSIKLGINKGSFNFSEGKKTYIEINDSSYLSFGNDVIISKGSYICLNNNSKIIFNNRFSCNSNCLFSSQSSIIFGEDCMLGWNCIIIDGDGHKTSKSKENNEIVIGNHVWIGADCKILKGSTISTGSVVGIGSIVSGKFTQDNILITSDKAKERGRNFKWIR